MVSFMCQPDWVNGYTGQRGGKTLSLSTFVWVFLEDLSI